MIVSDYQDMDPSLSLTEEHVKAIADDYHHLMMTEDIPRHEVKEDIPRPDHNFMKEDVPRLEMKEDMPRHEMKEDIPRPDHNFMKEDIPRHEELEEEWSGGRRSSRRSSGGSFWSGTFGSLLLLSLGGAVAYVTIRLIQRRLRRHRSSSSLPITSWSEPEPSLFGFRADELRRRVGYGRNDEKTSMWV